ncbi:MAG: hypothetical protein JWM36_1418 [Hyphomicrobiales bacterium]|nr:hypothetical protein [Hyphomicrobiales bacterium]
MIKLLFMTVIGLGGLGFNVLLYLGNEGVNVTSERSAGGWKIDCKYYTPVRLFVVQIDTGRSCPERIVTR